MNNSLHFVCLLFLAMLALVNCQSAPGATARPQDNRGRYNPYYNDPYYSGRYYKNRDYFNNRQYYDNLFKRYNPDVAAPQARILEQDVDMQHDGTYSYSFETENGIHAEERGMPVKVGTEEQKEVVEGSYSFVTPEGIRVIVKYIANENGYHPTITYEGPNAATFAQQQQPADIVITRTN